MNGGPFEIDPEHKSVLRKDALKRGFPAYATPGN